MKIPKHVNTYTSLLTAEIISTIGEYANFEAVSDIDNEKMNLAVQDILIRETHDTQEAV